MAILTTQEDMDRYKKLDKLGEGTYGTVYRATDLKTNKTVAIKKIKLLDQNEEGIPPTTLREISLLKALKHPNIVEMSAVLYDEGDIFLIFEFMTFDLRNFLDDLGDKELEMKVIKRFTYALTEGIRFCHSHRILHRDLKPQNLLVSDDLTLKIADFGLGKEHGLPIVELTHEVVTLWYRPPEILLGKKRYSGACDVWGIGCILAETATKDPFVAGDSEINQLFQIYRILGTPNRSIWSEVEDLPNWTPICPQWKKKDLSEELEYKLDADGVDLLAKTLIYCPRQRITAKRMLVHCWFDEIREEMMEIYGAGYPHCGKEQWQRERNERLKKERLAARREMKRKLEEQLEWEQEDQVEGGNEHRGNEGANKEDSESELDLSTYFIDDKDIASDDSEVAPVPQPGMAPEIPSPPGQYQEEGNSEDEEDVTRNAENIDDWDKREPDRYENRYSIPMDEDEEDGNL